MSSVTSAIPQQGVKDFSVHTTNEARVINEIDCDDKSRLKQVMKLIIRIVKY